MGERRVRKTTRTRRSEQEGRNGGDARGYLERWGGVIRGIVEMDIGPAHAELERSLRSPSQTGSALLAALGRVGSDYAEACKLRERARLDYETYKVDHAEWLEAKRAASRQALEELKKEGRLSKPPTEAQVKDNVIATWPDEYRRRMRDLQAFEAAVETLRKLPDAFQVRARALANQKDLLLKLDVPGGRD